MREATSHDESYAGSPHAYDLPLSMIWLGAKQKALPARLSGIATRTIYRRVKGEQEPSSTESPSRPVVSDRAASPSESPLKND